MGGRNPGRLPSRGNVPLEYGVAGQRTALQVEGTCSVRARRRELRRPGGFQCLELRNRGRTWTGRGPQERPPYAVASFEWHGLSDKCRSAAWLTC